MPNYKDFDLDIQNDIPAQPWTSIEYSKKVMCPESYTCYVTSCKVICHN